MRYWLWMAVKLVLAAALVLEFWEVAVIFVGPGPTGLLANWPRLGSDLAYTFAMAFTIIFACGLVWALAVDQLYRCRRCGRRLRMPRSAGNYSRVMLGGDPYTEYICTYGHGKLYVPNVHLSSSRAIGWIGYGSLWENLMQAEHGDAAGKPGPR